jgi:PIN domain nuclease of toxin-antitoxin system
MKVLLDTTYLLPTIGIAIKEISKDTAIKLQSKGYELSISEITLFELSAKAAKYVQEGYLLPERVTLGIRSIMHDESFKKIPSYNSQILLSAFSLRCLTNDFIDCIILSTALNNSDILVTEDQVINGIKKNKKYLELKASVNPKFEIRTAREIQGL